MTARPAPSIRQEARIAAVRAFNRFYTQKLGLLNEGLLQSDWSLTEIRLLYELASRQGLTATAIQRDLNLDPGYLSRVLKKFRLRGWLKRTPARGDARRLILALTPSGRAAFAPLDKASQDEMRAMLERLPGGGAAKLVAAVETVRRLLDGAPGAAAPFLLRSLQPGDIGWIAHRQGLIYFQEYGWNMTFEALVAEIAASFAKNHDSARERCWLAERDGEIAGSVFLVRESDRVAKLRLLYVEPSSRGLGIGRRLVDECVVFARRKGYRTLALWTNDVLVSARRLYEAAGFRVVAQERHHSFGRDLVGQNWELDLAGRR
jgi:DNA-binding MarR family transcriptional regulator/GNAT superfamily N-acetyltransferase